MDGVSFESRPRLEYFEDVSLSLFKLENLLLSDVSLLFSLVKLPYLVTESDSLLNASRQLLAPPPLSYLELLVDPPVSNLDIPESVLPVLTGLLPYFGNELLESELAKLDLHEGVEED